MSSQKEDIRPALCQGRRRNKGVQKTVYEKWGELWLWDFDSYDYIKLGMTLQDVINCETRKCGHGFILAMMLQNQRVWECTT